MYADDLRCSRVDFVSLESLEVALVFFSLGAGCSRKPWLQIRQPYVSRPSIAADRNPMRALIVLQ
jgi:hypothetical protein